jgi:SAM-dependent methyltransferase
VPPPVTSRRASPYLLENAAAQAGERFAALSAAFDPITFGHLDALGVGPTWRCWEVGAGGPSVAAWLAQRVGSAGRVVATDIDTSWLDNLPASVEVRVHDVAADDPPGDGFDLVHARLVLVHIPDRDRALRNMVDSLRPGGWLVLEDFDPLLLPDACLDPSTDDHHRANRIRQGFLQLLDARGVDLRYGRRLPRALRNAGLVDVAAQAAFPVATPASRQLEVANTTQVADGLVAAGHATAGEIEQHVSAVTSGRIDVATPPLVSAWGRRR